MGRNVFFENLTCKIHYNKKRKRPDETDTLTIPDHYTTCDFKNCNGNSFMHSSGSRSSSVVRNVSSVLGNELNMAPAITCQEIDQSLCEDSKDKALEMTDQAKYKNRDYIWYWEQHGGFVFRSPCDGTWMEDSLCELLSSCPLSHSLADFELIWIYLYLLKTKRPKLLAIPCVALIPSLNGVYCALQTVLAADGNINPKSCLVLSRTQFIIFILHLLFFFVLFWSFITTLHYWCISHAAY